MAVVPQEAVDQFEALMKEADAPLKRTFQNIHQGDPHETLIRFLKAREGNVAKAHTMLVDCLNWRVENDIDGMLAKPIIPVELYRAIRDTQLIGMSGYSNEGLPVFAVGVGMSTFDRASVHYYVQSHIQINEYRDRVVLPSASRKYGKHVSKCIKVLDMTGLKLSALNHIKVVKPLLQERTRRKINVLSGCGHDDLLKIMDFSSLPHFCHKRSSGSSINLDVHLKNCFSLDHPFHQQLYSYIKQRSLDRQHVQPLKQGSVHVTLPKDAVEGDIAKILESELEKFEDLERCSDSLGALKIIDG